MDQIKPDPVLLQGKGPAPAMPDSYTNINNINILL
jgi:hypothetical protein